MPSVSSVRPATILIADDDYGHRRMLEIVLTARRFEVVGAQDGREALELLRDHTPDLMILDVDMPFASGFDVIDQARAEERLRNVPMIIMTGQELETIEARAEVSRPDALVFKPIGSRALRELIGGILGEPA